MTLIFGFEKFRERKYVLDAESGIPLKELSSKIDQYIFTNDIGAISVAMEMEDKAYNLYKKLSEKE